MVIRNSPTTMALVFACVLSNIIFGQVPTPPPPAADPVSLTATTIAPTADPMATVSRRGYDGAPPNLDVKLDDPRVWYYPWSWLPRDGWSNSAELGIKRFGRQRQRVQHSSGHAFQTQKPTSTCSTCA